MLFSLGGRKCICGDGFLGWKVCLDGEMEAVVQYLGLEGWFRPVTMADD